MSRCETNDQLDGAHIEVTSTSDVETKASVLPTSGSTPVGAGTGTISQEDKPRAAIVAEYLAHGYVLSDHVIQQAIDLDREWTDPRPLAERAEKHGISKNFLDFFNSIDHKAGHHLIGENQTVSGRLNESAAAATAKAREIDQNRGISAKGVEYYGKMLQTPFGQK